MHRELTGASAGTASIVYIDRNLQGGENLILQDEINYKVSERLKELMEAKGLTKAGLSQKAGISASNLYSILRGDTIPNIYTLILLCQAMDVSLAFFLKPIETNNVAAKESEWTQYADRLSTKNQQIITAVINVLLKYQ